VAVHLALDQLLLGDLSFGLTVGPWLGDRRCNRMAVLGDAVSERAEQAAGGVAEPGIEGCAGFRARIVAISSLGLDSTRMIRERQLQETPYGKIWLIDLAFRP